ncbi:MAG: HNH endonuclease, partial [Nitrososphaerales archaeon]
MKSTRVHIRRRHISLRVYKNKYDDNNNKLCLNCGDPVIGRRTDAKYCSNDCSWNFYVKNNWRLLRIKILRRDRFTCQLCGDNRSRVRVNGRVRRNFNVDHKMPIFKGGREFDESNLWT